MDKRKIDALKKIQELRDKNISPDYDSLGKNGFESSLLRVMIIEGLIRWGGVFSLTEKGDNILRDYLVIESKKNKPKLKIMLDTNAINRIADGNISVNDLEKYGQTVDFYITHQQSDEVARTPNIERRGCLVLFLTKIRPIVIATESFVTESSRLGFARLGDGQVFQEMKKENPKHTEDALIGETAIKEGCILLTDDKKLQNKVRNAGGKVLSIAEFEEMMKNEK